MHSLSVPLSDLSKLHSLCVPSLDIIASCEDLQPLSSVCRSSPMASTYTLHVHIMYSSVNSEYLYSYPSMDSVHSFESLHTHPPPLPVKTTLKNRCLHFLSPVCPPVFNHCLGRVRALFVPCMDGSIPMLRTDTSCPRLRQ